MGRKRTAELPAPYAEKVAELRQLLGQTVSLTWGIGSQQTKHVTDGTLTDVRTDDTNSAGDPIPPYAVLTVPHSVAGKNKPATFRLPLSFLVRYAQ